jgi:hypothetical protein
LSALCPRRLRRKHRRAYDRRPYSGPSEGGNRSHLALTPRVAWANKTLFISATRICSAVLPERSSLTTTPIRRADRFYAATGPIPVRATLSNSAARPARNGGLHAGSMSMRLPTAGNIFPLGLCSPWQATAHVADQTETFCEDGCALPRRTNSGGLALRRITFLCIELGRGDAYVSDVRFVMCL